MDISGFMRIKEKRKILIKIKVPNIEIGTAKMIRPETNNPIKKVEITESIKTQKKLTKISLILAFSETLAFS